MTTAARLIPEDLSTKRADAGRRGATKRWGPPRVIRLDGLAPEQRALIVELVEVQKRHAARTGEDAA